MPKLVYVRFSLRFLFSNDPLFVALIFDMLKRRGTSVGVAITTRSDPESIETMAENSGKLYARSHEQVLATK